MVWISALLVALGLVFVARGVMMARPGAGSRPYRRYIKPPAWLRVPSGRRALGLAVAGIVALAVGTAAMDAARRPQRPAEADALVEEGSSRIPDGAAQLMLPNAAGNRQALAESSPAPVSPPPVAAPQTSQGSPPSLVLPQSDDNGQRRGREQATNETAESAENQRDDKKDEKKPEPSPQPDDGESGGGDDGGDAGGEDQSTNEGGDGE